jgi:DNA-binding CsgD family transcriptional regulator
MTEGYQSLTEKEKQTLRLVVQGYDAKSMARHLGRSVHTINERLRHARRKMAVSSSREAARMLLYREGQTPHSLADKDLGEAGTAPAVGQRDTPEDGRKARLSLAWAIGGMVIMSLVLATILLSSTSLAPAPEVAAANIAPNEAGAPNAVASRSEVVQAAREWLALVDEGLWDESWNATGQAFRQLNTSKAWASLSAEVRPPLGEVLSRTATGQEEIPAPPYGYQLVKFRTTFANRGETTETVTLEREGEAWKVVGYLIG